MIIRSYDEDGALTETETPEPVTPKAPQPTKAELLAKIQELTDAVSSLKE